jgi:hypothetical protein
MDAGTRPTGRSRPEGGAVQRPGVRVSGLEGEGAKGRRVSSGAKRRANHGDRRGGASGGCRAHQEGGERSVRKVATPTAGSPRSGASLRSEVAPGAGNKRKDRRAEAVTAKRVSAVGPELKIHVCADERSVRRTRSRPRKSPRTGSLSKAKSAGTGQRESTSGRRGGPVAAKRSSGETRRQGESHLEWSPFRARPSEAKSRRVRGAYNVQSRRAEAVTAKHVSADGPKADGEPWGADGSRRGSLAAAARSAAPQADAVAGWAGSAMLEKFFNGETDVAGDLTKEDGRDVSPRMTGNGGSPSVRVAELLMTPLLARLHKTETFEDGHDFGWLQYGARSHRQATTTL